MPITIQKRALELVVLGLTTCCVCGMVTGMIGLVLSSTIATLPITAVGASVICDAFPHREQGEVSTGSNKPHCRQYITG